MEQIAFRNINGYSSNLKFLSNQRPCKRMAIKLTVYMAPMFEIIREQMPSLKMFFNTRHPKKSMISYFKTFQVRI